MCRGVMRLVELLGKGGGHSYHAHGNVSAYKALLGKPEKNGPLEVIGVDERINLLWIKN